VVIILAPDLRRGKPIYAAARDHTFHRLLALGWTSNRAVLAMQVASLLLGCLAFVVLTRPPILANGIFAAVLLAGALILTYLDSRARWS